MSDSIQARVDAAYLEAAIDDGDPILRSGNPELKSFTAMLAVAGLLLSVKPIGP